MFYDAFTVYEIELLADGGWEMLVTLLIRRSSAP